MPLKTSLQLLLSPDAQWQRLADLPASHYNRFLFYPALMALVPAIAWYFGLTQAGWQVGGGDTVRLTADSALRIVVLFYIALLVCLGVIGYLVHWMSATYGCDTSTAKGIAVVGFTATPLFVFGLMGVYPLFWLDLTVGLLALSWSLQMLYTGIPIVMKIPAERGFLYASAIVAAGLVVFMALMGASVILWDMGAAPVFTD